MGSNISLERRTLVAALAALGIDWLVLGGAKAAINRKDPIQSNQIESESGTLEQLGYHRLESAVLPDAPKPDINRVLKGIGKSQDLEAYLHLIARTHTQATGSGYREQLKKGTASFNNPVEIVIAQGVKERRGNDIATILNHTGLNYVVIDSSVKNEDLIPKIAKGLAALAYGSNDIVIQAYAHRITSLMMANNPKLFELGSNSPIERMLTSYRQSVTSASNEQISSLPESHYIFFLYHACKIGLPEKGFGDLLSEKQKMGFGDLDRVVDFAKRVLPNYGEFAKGQVEKRLRAPGANHYDKSAWKAYFDFGMLEMTRKYIAAKNPAAAALAKSIN